MKTDTPTWAKWLFTTIALLGGLFLLLTITLNFWIEPLVEKAARLGLRQLSENGYQIDFQKLDLKPLTREISLRDVSVSVDSSQHSRFLAKGSFVTGHLDKIELKLDKYPYWESDRTLSVTNMRLVGPNVEVHQSAFKEEEDSVALPENTFKLIQPFFDSLYIGTISVKDGQVKRILQGDDQPDTLTLPPVQLTIKDILLDSLTAEKNNGLPTVESWVMDAGIFTSISKDSLYTYSVGHTHTDLINGTLAFNEIRVQPNFAKGEFAAHIGEQKDRMEAYIHSLELEDLQVSQLSKKGMLLAPRMVIDSATLSIFKDKRFPRPIAKRLLLQDMLHSIPVIFQIDTISLASSQIMYEEKNGFSEEAGQVVFDHLFATLYGTTNNPNVHTTLRIDTRSNLMSDALIQLNIQVPLGSKNGTHYISGRLDRMHLENLNRLLEPVAFASVRSGVANLLDFSMTLNERSATGEVRFIYNDLKVDLLNRENPDNPALKELMGTWLANWFVVKTDNPTRNQPLRVGNIYFEYDGNRSVVSYWCQALLTGIKESIGVPTPDTPTASIETTQDEEKENAGFLKKLFGSNKE
uniref:DUF748 domain-containing protein n=1 Tax=Roseihalotalea indica TaxID=2867963 RepID=A0AA49GJQ0_9BACT|nr:hypothetical protein K4G66_23300 [Tunicatimonas sp. TK19036]